MRKSIGEAVKSVSVAATFVAITLAVPSGGWAQQKAGDLKKQILGGWTAVSAVSEQGGKKVEPFGANPLGFLSFDQSGNFSLMTLPSNLPKIASNNRLTPTPEESKAIAQGILAYYGKYTVNETDSSVNLTIRGSSFPNFVGTEQKRFITVTGDDLRFVSPTPPTAAGTTVTVMYKRAK
jgi:hypothetical protein